MVDLAINSIATPFRLEQNLYTFDYDERLMLEGIVLCLYNILSKFLVVSPMYSVRQSLPVVE